MISYHLLTNHVFHLYYAHHSGIVSYIATNIYVNSKQLANKIKDVHICKFYGKLHVIGNKGPLIYLSKSHENPQNVPFVVNDGTIDYSNLICQNIVGSNSS